MGVKIPAQGTGDTTPTVGTDKVGGIDYQQVKLIDGTIGGSQGAIVDANGRLQISGYVGASVPNFPATQSVQGLVGASVPNFPVLQAVSGYLGASVANLPGTQPVSIASSSVQVGASISNFPAVQPVSGSVSVVNLPAIQPVSGSVSINNFPATQPVSGNVTASVIGQVGASVTNWPATQQVAVASIAATAGQLGASISNFPATQPISGYVGASIAGGGSITTYPAAATVGGASPYHFIAGASVNNVSVKTTAGTVYAIAAMNVNASARYLRLYDKSSTPSVGQDVPVQTYVVPGNTAGAGAIVPIPVGMLFQAGIGFGITGGSMSDTDQTVTGLGDVVLNLSYR